jgi:hypothetical protein
VIQKHRSGKWTSYRLPNTGIPSIHKSFHEKAGRSQDGFFVLPIVDLYFNRAASVAVLPSAVFDERWSLAASWASLIE